MFLLEILGIVLILLLWLLLLVVFVGGPILGLIGWWRGRYHRLRIQALEDEIAQLKLGALFGRPVSSSTESEVREAAPEILESEPEPPPPEPEETPEPEHVPSHLEGWFGGRFLGWAAVGLLMLSAGYFLQFAFQNGLIGPLGQVSLGILGGTALCVAGFRIHRNDQWLFGQMLSAAGVSILYLSVFASFGYYDLLPMSRAGMYLTLVVVLTAGLAIAYPARGIAVLALVGGLVAPTLLVSERDPYISFFLYLGLLDLGMLVMALVRGWKMLAPLALIGVQCLFWGWVAGNYHPEKRSAVLIFQGVLFLLHTWHDVVLPVLRNRRATISQLLDLVLNAYFLGLAGTAFLHDDFGKWLAILAVIAAILYALQSRIVQMREPIDAPLQVGLVAIGFSFLAAAFALRLEAGWIGVAWAVQGLGLWWYGIRVRSVAMRTLAGVLLFLSVIQVLFGGLWAPPAYSYQPDPLSPAGWMIQAEWLWPVFNRHAFPGVLVTVCLLTAAYLSRTRLSPREKSERRIWLVLVLGGLLLGLLILSTDVVRVVRTLELRNDWSRYDSFSLTGMSLTILWALYAALVLTVGFWRDSRVLRQAALGLFGLAMLKALLWDSSSLMGFSRVVAFFVLAAVMGAAAWVYQQLERAHRKATAREVQS